MSRLPQLAETPYRPCDWDLKTDARGRAYWLEHFCRHVEVLLPLIREEYPQTPPERVAAFRADYLAAFAAIAQKPDAHPRLDILYFDELRTGMLARYGFADPFRGIKTRENEAALRLLPRLLDELDTLPPDQQRDALARGLLAGNIFDLGSLAVAQQYYEGKITFAKACANQAPRPWLIDHDELWWVKWSQTDAAPPYRHALFFVDNAGSDVVLGCLPFARWLVRSGMRVTLAANSGPALNDITAAELEPLVERAAQSDPTLGLALENARLHVLATGCRAPLIDLAELTEPFADQARDADLIVLHGMGRAVESNFHARLRCDVLRTAVLKDATIANRLGGRLFDCVFRFSPAGD